MAIYHFSLKPIGRGDGYSAVGAAAYRSGGKLKESEQSMALRTKRVKALEKQLPEAKGNYLSLQRQLLQLEEDSKEWKATNTKLNWWVRKLNAYDREVHNVEKYGVHDYRKKGSDGVLHSEILLPSDAPEWMRDREKLWNEAEIAEETRINGRTAREVVIALPHELCQAKQIELSVKLGKWFRDGYNVAVDVALHPPHKDGDSRNFHAHIMFTTRKVTSTGLGEKTKILDDKFGGKEVALMRKAWEVMANDALEESGGSVARIDCRSHEDKDSGQIPNIHLGKTATAMERRGVDTIKGNLWRSIEQKNIQASNDNLQSQPLDRNKLLERTRALSMNMMLEEDYQLHQQQSMQGHHENSKGFER